MAIPFHNLDDVQRRIHGTICSYDGQPVHVSATVDHEQVQIATFSEVQKLHPERWRFIQVADPKFSYRSLPLGYLAYNGQAIYLTRVPSRQMHAALHPDVIISNDGRFSVRNIWRQKSMEECILGKHMRPDRAVKKIIYEGYQGMPIHRHVSVGKVDDYRAGLYYRTRLVGWHIADTRFELFNAPDSSFIQRTINDLKIGIKV